MTDHCQPPSRRVSFIVPDNQRVGGFGDRLLGLVTTMYVAVMTSSGLVVNWTVPYDLRQYFHVLDCANVQAGGSRRRGQRNAERVPFPRPVNTTHNERAIDAWSYFQNGTFLNEISRDVDLITNARHWLNVVQTPGLEDMAHHLGVASLSRQQLFKLAVDVLLKPRRNVLAAARMVHAKMEAASPQPANSAGGDALPFYVGVQIRCGSHASLAWSDETRHSLADVPCFAAEALLACGSRPTCPIFLTADSQPAVDAFKAEIGNNHAWRRRTLIVQAGGPILHTDRTNSSAASATGTADPWLRSIVDWWLLKHASNLVISRSGFGETAAWASSVGAAARRVELGAAAACNVTDFGTRSAIDN